MSEPEKQPAVASSGDKADDTISSHKAVVVASKKADVTHGLLEEYGATVGELTPEKLRRIKWKLWMGVLLLVTIIDLILYMDKATMSQSTLLGIMADTHLTDKTYNNLNTIFYAGYIIGQGPGLYIIQRVPMRLYVTAVTFTWSLVVFLHCVATSYGDLIPLRFFLGVVESSMLPALEMTMTMFFPPDELHQVQPLFYSSCVGSVIPAGLLAYGLLFSKSPVSPWKFFMITTGGLSFILSIVCWFVYPSNPATAWFLTTEEKVHVIQRVHDATKSSIEQKTIKMYQLYEALRDPTSWLFAFSNFFLMLANNLTYQTSLLFLDIGVSNLGSTLVWVAAGGFSVAVCVVASVLLRWFPGWSSYWAALWCLPAIAGSIGMLALAWDKTIPLLACLLLAGNTFAMTWIIQLAWTSSSCAGYTKKLTRNAMFMVGYGIANIISPQLWVSGGPRYHAAWIVQIVLSFVCAPGLLFVIRFILQRRNKHRREWIAEQAALGNFGEGYLEEVNEAGEIVKVKVDVSLLDLTDLENKFFVYPL